jgi:hypothetical protein
VLDLKNIYIEDTGWDIAALTSLRQLTLQDCPSDFLPQDLWLLP